MRIISRQIYGAKKAYDYVHRCWSRYQTVVTAAVSNPHRVDGLAVEVQQPSYQKAELAYLAMTQRESVVWRSLRFSMPGVRAKNLSGLAVAGP